MKTKVTIDGTDAIITDEFGIHTCPINLTYAARIIDAAGDDEKLVGRITEILNAGEVLTEDQLETDEQLDAAIAAIESRRGAARAARKASAPGHKPAAADPEAPPEAPAKPKAKTTAKKKPAKK